MRLRSRAFVVETPCNAKCIVFVSADLGQIFQAVKQGVIKKLQSRYGSQYSAPMSCSAPRIADLEVIHTMVCII